MTTIYSKAGTDAAISGAVAAIAAPDLSDYVPATDARLSDARWPLAHAASHAAGQADAITPASIGAATAAQGAKADSASQPGHGHQAAAITDSTAAGRALLTAADVPAQRGALGLGTAATTDASDYATNALDRARRGRDNAARWTLASDGMPVLTSVGLTLTGGYLGATVAGTNGDAVMPNWRTEQDFRASFRVKVTKATAGTISGVGFTAFNTLRASLPDAAHIAWVIGYVQGSGIAVKPYNVSGGVVSNVLVPDASLADGQEWDIGIWADPYLNRKASPNIAVYYRAIQSTGGTEYRGTLNVNEAFLPTNVLIRTNAAGQVLTNIEIATHPTATVGVSTVGAGRYYAGDTTENMALRIAAKPNGKLVFAMHGHGSTGELISRTSYMMPSWEALMSAGFSVAFPDLGSPTHWANDKALTYLAEAHRLLVADYDFDPEVYMYGISMGGGTTLTAIAKKIIPIRAAYLAHPSCDMRSRWADPATWPTLQTAYAGVEADMLDNNPITQPASAYAGVPMLFTASAGDTLTLKSEHTDAMRTMLGTVNPNYLITVTGDHMNPSHFRAQDALNFFRANI